MIFLLTLQKKRKWRHRKSQNRCRLPNNLLRQESYSCDKLEHAVLKDPKQGWSEKQQRNFICVNVNEIDGCFCLFRHKPMESNWKKRFILLNGPRKKINDWHNQRRQLMQFCCSWCLNLKWCILAKNECIGQIFFFIFLWKADRNSLTSHMVLMKLSWG